ncbi:NAD-dependent epimerase/dehydratase family protein [Luteipulveratus mongoliensis]|uniref:Dehydrogenase n=1 Tax=Luteipulveratus mongoliensis TaxID=571913 RepID=A0A0K1JNT1_9MICO|nr:NAD(P)-dependent oxidoreductase [Luteipulveratus mongoliensis]AKU18377.1 dehydrogenase [Luteipulveratus mongoliensis]
MKIFVAGASGAVGKHLVPQLIRAGHDVTGSTTSEAGARRLRDAGVVPAVMDGLDADSVRAAVLAAEPDVVIHQMTALASLKDMKHFDRQFHRTNLLRTDGTDHLLAAAREAGAKRFIAASYTGWPNERTGGPVKTEADPLDTQPHSDSKETLAAIRYMERVVSEAVDIEGVVLRYGAFYGPGNALAPGGEMWEQVRGRKLPLVGDASGVFSFTHIEDAASAAVVAVDHGGPGIYNIVDDEPAPVSVWLPYLSEVVGAKPPLRVPAWLAKPLAGGFAVGMMTTGRGSSNAKAKRELGWTPTYASWRDGFRATAGVGPAA